MKETIPTIYEKNLIVEKIFTALTDKENFFVVGHKNPDEDCIASMVAFSLLAGKFSKNVSLYISEPVHEHFLYLLDISVYNSIAYLKKGDKIEGKIDALVVCDTPKPDMVDSPPAIAALMKKEEVLTIEIDHHIGADSDYIGDRDHALVTEASSASELVGLLALKLLHKKDLLERFDIDNPLSRNVVLSVLTGIIGDTGMGKYIKSRREDRYYSLFSSLYNKLLIKETTRATNFTNMTDVFQEIKRLSGEEADCLQYFNEHKKESPSINYVVLKKEEMEYLSSRFDCDTIISVARTITDSLAEESGRLGMVAYDDRFCGSDLIQFRLRRSKKFKSFDVRAVLEMFSIKNGGGHEGAIGYRIPAEQVGDLEIYLTKTVEGIEKAIGG